MFEQKRALPFLSIVGWRPRPSSGAPDTSQRGAGPCIWKSAKGGQWKRAGVEHGPVSGGVPSSIGDGVAVSEIAPPRLWRCWVSSRGACVGESPPWGVRSQRREEGGLSGRAGLVLCKSPRPMHAAMSATLVIGRGGMCVVYMCAWCAGGCA